MNISEINFSNLDVNNIGSWPLPFRVFVFVLIFLLVVGGGYYYLTNDQLVELDKVQAEETSLRAEFEGIQAKVKNLDAYKEQLADMKQTFGALIRQLPGSTEVPDLLVDTCNNSPRPGTPGRAPCWGYDYSSGDWSPGRGRQAQ